MEPISVILEQSADIHGVGRKCYVYDTDHQLSSYKFRITAFHNALQNGPVNTKWFCTINSDCTLEEYPFILTSLAPDCSVFYVIVNSDMK